MRRQIIAIAVALVLVPIVAFSDCYENCYDSDCDVPGACETECDNDICYYYDDDGNCWEYDADFGFYPCGYDCYHCDDGCCDDDDCDDDCDCDCDHDHDHDDYWDDHSCFIRAIAP
ncbi:MAG: hypothetical protein AB1724_13545 [Thermodesulfobacteriota bacterium]